MHYNNNSLNSLSFKYILLSITLYTYLSIDYYFTVLLKIKYKTRYKSKGILSNTKKFCFICFKTL